MASVIGGNQVKLNSGQVVSAQTGGWYDGQQFWNGSLSNPGQFNSQNNQAGQGGGAAPVQSTSDAAYLAGRGDTGAPNRVVGSNNGGGGSNGSSSGGGFAAPQSPPPFDLVGATNAAYNTPEITAANKAIGDVNTKITARQQALADASAGINDNPFYSEATRVGKQAQLTSEANADIGVLQNQSSQAEQQLTNLKAEAAIKVNAALGQYNINRQSYQDTLSQFDNLLKAGAITNASPGDLANLSVQTGIPISELQSIQTVEKQQGVKTSLVTSNNGTISVINDATGEIISQTNPGVGASAKGSGSTGGSVGTTGISTKEVNNALSILAQQDTVNTGGKGADYQLSQQEKQSAYNQILALVGGNITAAKALFEQAWGQGGYKDFNPSGSTAGGSSNNTNSGGGLLDWFSGLPGPSF